jgi:hypothetical protein
MQGEKIVPANLIKESRCFTQEPTNLIRFFPTIISVLFVIKISRWQKRKAKIIASNKQQIQLSVVKKLRFRFHRGFSIRPVQFDPPLAKVCGGGFRTCTHYALVTCEGGVKKRSLPFSVKRKCAYARRMCAYVDKCIFLGAILKIPLPIRTPADK